MSGPVLRPGAGWKRVGPCFDHAPTGIRVHLHGMYRTPAGDIVVGSQWPESRQLDRAVRIAGGNHRRGVMVWALNHHLRGVAA